MAKDYPYGCHLCRGKLGKDDWVEKQTPIIPVRVHKECEVEWMRIQNMVMTAMFGRLR